MNSRERVLRAFRRVEGLPDRVPVEFDLCAQLAEHFGKKLNIPVKVTNNLYEDVTYRISANELRLAMGSDVVITGASVSDDFKMVTETMAKIYLKQGNKSKALKIYRQLMLNNPKKSVYFADRIKEIENNLNN